MNNVLEDSLFVSQTKKFDEIQSIVRQFSAEYVGNSIIKDNIFAVIQNYARKKEIALELLRYPIHDDELWALTFLKQDTIFVCVNTALPLCKQFFAAAHELYHIYCYVENADQSYIKNGSMLDSATGDETGRTQEDLEANAFAGLLLMPDQLLHEQILLYGLDKDLVTVDSVLMLMDMLGVFESGLERLLIFPSALLFVLLHFLFCAEDAVYIGTHGLEFFVIILEIMVSIVLGVLLNRKLLFFCSKVFHSKKLSIRRVLLQNLKCFFILGKFVRVGLTESFLIRSL